MKAKSRRRLLISSVAMLLVAMLALGTATFAWFTVDTSTTAKGIQVKTNKVSSLQVSSVNSIWTNDLTYPNADLTLNPASSANGLDWFYATASGPNASTAKSATVNKITNNASASSYMFYNMLNVKNAGTADITNPVYIELDNAGVKTIGENLNNAAASAKYLRVALVPATATTSYIDAQNDNRSAATVASADVFRANVYGATAGENGDSAAGILTATNNTNGDIATTATVSTKGNTIKVEVIGDGLTHGLAAGEAKYYMLIVWFEGQDTDCYDTNAGNEMPQLNFNIYEDKGN